jgi:hypothetical protein
MTEEQMRRRAIVRDLNPLTVPEASESTSAQAASPVP